MVILMLGLTGHNLLRTIFAQSVFFPSWIGRLLRRPRLGLMLIVYVDDFQFSGPKSNLKEGWALTRKGLNSGESEPIGIYLGCEHECLRH